MSILVLKSNLIVVFSAAFFFNAVFVLICVKEVLFFSMKFNEVFWCPSVSAKSLYNRRNRLAVVCYWYSIDG